MKKGSLLFFALFCFCFSFGQTSKVEEVVKYLKVYEISKSLESLEKAKNTITIIAGTRPLEKDSSTTFLLMSKIYLYLYEEDLKQTNIRLQDLDDENERTFTALAQTSVLNLDIASHAYDLAKSSDKSGGYNNYLQIEKRLQSHYFNAAQARFTTNRNKRALSLFEKANDLSEGKDSMALYLAALSAEGIGDNDLAINYYEKVIEFDEFEYNAYISLAKIYEKRNDSGKAAETIRAGLLKNRDNVDLQLLDVNYLIKENRTEEALERLNLLIPAQDTNVSLLLVRGSIYDHKLLSLDNHDKNPETIRRYLNIVKLAEADYKHVVKLKPDSFEANYDLGALYNNTAVYLYSVKKGTNFVENGGLTEEAIAFFLKAKPVLEKAHKIKSDDEDTISALAQVNTILGEYIIEN